MRPRTITSMPMAFAIISISLAMPSLAIAEQGSLSQSQQRAYDRFLKMGEVKEFPPTPWAKAFVLKGKYCHVRTNTSPEVARYLVMLVDSQAVALRKFFRFRMPNGKMEIWAFRTRDEFETHGSVVAGMKINSTTGGFWHPSSGGTILFPYLGEGGVDPAKVLLHEMAHGFLHRALDSGSSPRNPWQRPTTRLNTPRTTARDPDRTNYSDKIPTWLDEGLAVFFEESRYNPATQQLELAFVPKDNLRYLQFEIQTNRHVRLSDVFAAKRETFTVAHYRTSWSFVYWLLCSADTKESLRRQQALNRYLFDVRKGDTDSSRLLGYLGMPLEEIRPQWQEWILGLDPEDDRGGTRVRGE